MQELSFSKRIAITCKKIRTANRQNFILKTSFIISQRWACHAPTKVSRTWLGPEDGPELCLFGDEVGHVYRPSMDAATDTEPSGRRYHWVNTALARVRMFLFRRRRDRTVAYKPRSSFLSLFRNTAAAYFPGSWIASVYIRPITYTNQWPRAVRGSKVMPSSQPAERIDRSQSCIWYSGPRTWRIHESTKFSTQLGPSPIGYAVDGR